jgi:hypothetical protein
MIVHEAGHRSVGVVVAAVLCCLALLVPATPALAAPQITISPDAGGPGTRVTLTGANFDSYKGDRLSVFFNSSEIAASPVTVSDGGEFSVLFDVPDDAVAGAARVSVAGPLGATLAEAYLDVPVRHIVIDPTSGIVGAAVAVTGQGFHADAIIEFIFVAGGIRADLGTAVAGPTGDCAFSLVIPSGPAGPQQVLAYDGEGNQATGAFAVVPRAIVEPSSNTVGRAVAVHATGLAGVSEVTVYFGNAAVTSGVTDEAGAFEAHFNVPVTPGGLYDVRVQDQQGNAGISEFTVMSLAALDRTTGNVGTTVGVSGSGYAAGAAVTIDYDDAPVAAAETDFLGNFAAEFVAPRSVGGLHSVGVDDGAARFVLVFAMEEAPPPPPPLIEPSDGSEAAQPVVFLWGAVDDASRPIVYGLQVAADAGFRDILADRPGLSRTSLTMAAGELPSGLTRTELYWRVMATDSAANESQWSGPWVFYLPSPSGLPIWAIGALIAVGVVIVGMLIFRIVRDMSY